MAKAFSVKGDKEIMSFGFGDIDGDGYQDITSLAKNASSLVTSAGTIRHGNQSSSISLEMSAISVMPSLGTWTAMVTPTSRFLPGIQRITRGHLVRKSRRPPQRTWASRTVSGTEKGIKYDHLEVLDIDGDGDLDILTCEEHETNGGLGVIWYENSVNKLIAG